VEKVGLTKKQLERYPHEFSGGQRQRLCIARAIALNPQVLIADEPVSALDVSIQAKVLDLLTSLQEEFSITFLFVSHDMAVVEKMSDDIAVMYMGRIVEYGDRNSILSNPVHPYTQNLLTSVPIPNPEIKMNEPKFYEKGRISPIISADQKVSKEIEYKNISPTHRVIVS
jgi:ABC-type oligopeptide transport system ATPase subunit